MHVTLPVMYSWQETLVPGLLCKHRPPWCLQGLRWHPNMTHLTALTPFACRCAVSASTSLVVCA